MSLDPYQLCPCGSGKKVKFCCSKDMVAELDKVIRAVQGKQRIAALEQLQALLKEKGSRPALLSLKADLQLSGGDVEAAEATVAEFLKVAPHNPVALALAAVVAASRENHQGAVETLQRALEYVDELMPPAVYSAIDLIARSLASAGQILAAYGHWLLQSRLAGDRDETPRKMLSQIITASEIPLLLKEAHRYAECPADAVWAGEFTAAMKSAYRGAWLAACESLDSLAEKVTDQPAILKNIAIFRGWLGQYDKAARAWHQYAALPDVPPHEAVEVEALSQLLGSSAGHEEVDQVTVTHPIEDMERLMESLISDRSVERLPIDPGDLAREDQPPPKGAFWLLDRPAVQTAADLKPQDIPCVIGEVYVYGRQTDREARLEFVATKTADFADKTAAIAKVAGKYLGAASGEETTGSVSQLGESLSWRCRLPDDMPREQRVELMRQRYRDVMLNRWPDLPAPVLDGKTPREVAGDEAYRVPLLATILLLELAADESAHGFDFNELRRQLGLPTRDPLPADGQDMKTVSLVRLGQFDAATFSDEQLLEAFQRAAVSQQPRVVQRICLEMLARADRLKDKISKLQIYDALVHSTSNSDQALEYVDAARRQALAEGESPAQWLLSELSIRLPRMEIDRCNELVKTLQARHLQEPGIASGLYELLVSYGVISPDGTAAAPSAPPPEQLPASEPAAAQPGQLWTPDSPTAPAGGEAKPKLWVPGMD